MKTHVIHINLTQGQVALTLCEEGKKRWLDMPAMRLEDDIDVEHVGKALQQAMSFVVGDMDLNEMR